MDYTRGSFLSLKKPFRLSNETVLKGWRKNLSFKFLFKFHKIMKKEDNETRADFIK